MVEKKKKKKKKKKKDEKKTNNQQQLNTERESKGHVVGAATDVDIRTVGTNEKDATESMDGNDRKWVSVWAVFRFLVF